MAAVRTREQRCGPHRRLRGLRRRRDDEDLGAEPRCAAHTGHPVDDLLGEQRGENDADEDEDEDRVYNRRAEQPDLEAD